MLFANKLIINNMEENTTPLIAETPTALIKFLRKEFILDF